MQFFIETIKPNVATDESKQDNVASTSTALSRMDGDSFSNTGIFKHPLSGEHLVQFPNGKLYIYLGVMVRYIDDLYPLIVLDRKK